MIKKRLDYFQKFSTWSILSEVENTWKCFFLKSMATFTVFEFRKDAALSCPSGYQCFEEGGVSNNFAVSGGGKEKMPPFSVSRKEREENQGVSSHG